MLKSKTEIEQGKNFALLQWSKWRAHSRARPVIQSRREHQRDKCGGGKLGHRTKRDDYKSTTWESDRVCDYQRKQKRDFSLRPIIQQTVERLLQKPQSLRHVSCLEEASEQANQRDIMAYTNSHRTRQNSLRASERYRVCKKLNEDKRHFTREKRQGAEQLSEWKGSNI